MLCRKLLDIYRVPDRIDGSIDEIDVLRYKSVQYWRSANAVLTRGTHAVRSEPAWSSVIRAWSTLGRGLRQYSTMELDADDIANAFPEQSRCGWVECLCSTYKPVHPLRMCKGCWTVAYCGGTCQKKCVFILCTSQLSNRVLFLRDWYRGHRKVCKRKGRHERNGICRK